MVPSVATMPGAQHPGDTKSPFTKKAVIADAITIPDCQKPRSVRNPHNGRPTTKIRQVAMVNETRAPREIGGVGDGSAAKAGTRNKRSRLTGVVRFGKSSNSVAFRVLSGGVGE